MTLPHPGSARQSHPAGMLVCDLHTHTLYSRDCLTSLKGLLAACRRRGLDRVAVTDHNTIAGALRLKEIAPEQVIIGEEIGTTHGELIAFFLSEPVPAGLAPLEAAEAVRAQGGVVGASHPLDRIRRDAMGRDVLLNLLGHLDFLEVFNARCLFPADNRAARNLAEEAELFMTGGSDAHCAWELGRGVTILPPFDSAASFLSGLSEARVQGRRTPVWIHLISSYAKIARHLGLPRSPDPWERDC